jgi:hypothetical protein
VDLVVQRASLHLTSFSFFFWNLMLGSTARIFSPTRVRARQF